MNKVENKTIIISYVLTVKVTRWKENKNMKQVY